MSEEKLLESLIEIQKDLGTVVSRMKLLSMDETFVTHCDFILNNMTFLKAVSALKIAVQSYNVYNNQTNNVHEETENDNSFNVFNDEPAMDEYPGDDDNFDTNMSFEADANHIIKTEKDDDWDYEPSPKRTRGKKSAAAKKTKGKRGRPKGSKSRLMLSPAETHHSDPPVQIEYSCPACSMPFKNLVRFRKHCETYHKDLSVDVDSCKTVIDTESAAPLVTVVNQSANSPNGTSQVELVEPASMTGPPTFEDISENQGDGSFLCMLCNKSIESEESMRSHVDFHSEDKTFKCIVCEKEFTTASTLRCHLKTHGYGGSFKCSYCSKEFMNKSYRDDHEKAEHTGCTRYKCDVCNRMFKEAWKLKVHMMKHTGAKPYKCSICEQAFHTNAELRVHTKTHNDDMDALCTTCGKTFKNRSALHSHMKRHEGEKDFSCKICGKNWYSKGALTEHMMVHSDERPFQCTECGTCFKKHSALKKHMDSHNGLRTQCRHCGEVFPSHYQCRRHELSHREGGNPFVCKYCGKAFDGGTKLRAHVNVHEGIRPFPCTICDKSFFNPKALKEHTMIHTGEKRHKCKYCGTCYTQSSTLGKHIKTVHATEYAQEGMTLVEAFQSKLKDARDRGVLIGTLAFRKSIKVGGPEGEEMTEEEAAAIEAQQTGATEEAAIAQVVHQAPPSPQPQAEASFAGLNLVKEAVPSQAALAPQLDYNTQTIITATHPRSLLQQQQQQQQQQAAAAASLQETYNTLFQLPGNQYYY